MLSAQCLTIIILCSVVNSLCWFELEHGITAWTLDDFSARHLQFELLVSNFIQLVRPNDFSHRDIVDQSIAMPTFDIIEVTIWLLRE